MDEMTRNRSEFCHLRPKRSTNPSPASPVTGNSSPENNNDGLSPGNSGRRIQREGGVSEESDRIQQLPNGNPLSSASGSSASTSRGRNNNHKNSGTVNTEEEPLPPG
ncbi:uncharacterized protein LOC111634365 isoform X2 [Centruroides sculpturatus]|nr:uncharacterized protein LOC111634365 isoform X2 [Centruroides sculpturatus]